MNDAKEEIKSRLAVEDVVGQYVELKRAGRNLKGRSPWGVDKTPSFMVSPEKGIWHDFSANKGGDIFTFIMEVEGVSFKEALEKLESRFTTLEVPVVIDRSAQEEDELAQAEWIKVYGAIYGEEDLAKKVFQKYMKDHKEKKLKGKSNDEK